MEITNIRTRVPAPDSQVLVSLPNTSTLVSNDENTLNLLGRASSDGKELNQNKLKSNRILTPKRYTIFSSFNTRTLSPTGRFEELVSNSISFKNDIIAVQEHRYYHPNETLKHHKLDQFLLITSSASKNSVNATIGGVGVFAVPKSQQQPREY